MVSPSATETTVPVKVAACARDSVRARAAIKQKADRMV